MSQGTIQELRSILTEAKQQFAVIIEREERAKREVEACQKQRYRVYDTAYAAWNMLRKLGAEEAGNERLGLEEAITGPGGGESRRELRVRSLVHELSTVLHALELNVGDGLTGVR
jgi:phage shock protein A